MNTKEETREARNRDGAVHKSKSPWPKELRVAVVRAVVDRKQATYTVALKLGVPYTTAIQWVKAYRERGEEALEVKRPALRPNLKKPPDARAQAILATHRDQPRAGSRRIRDVMKRFLGIGASETTVRRVLRSQGVKPQAAPSGVPEGGAYSRPSHRAQLRSAG